MIGYYITVCNGKVSRLLAGGEAGAAERAAESTWSDDPPAEDDAVTVHVRAPDGAVSCLSVRATYRRVCVVQSVCDVPDAETARLLDEGEGV